MEDKLFGDAEYLQTSEKRKLLRIWGKLTLSETQKISDEWRVFVGKFPCTLDSNENWNLLKQGLNQLHSNK